MEATKNAGMGGLPAAGRLGMPLQAAAIDRTPAGAALAAGPGVEAAAPAWWDLVKKGGGFLGDLGDAIF